LRNMLVSCPAVAAAATEVAPVALGAPETALVAAEVAALMPEIAEIAAVPVVRRALGSNDIVWAAAASEAGGKSRRGDTASSLGMAGGFVGAFEAAANNGDAKLSGEITRKACCTSSLGACATRALGEGSCATVGSARGPPACSSSESLEQPTW